MREDQQRGFYVEGLRRVACDSAVQMEQLIEQGTRTRTTAATHLNANSSRSHMLIIIQLKQVKNSNTVCVWIDTKILLKSLCFSEKPNCGSSAVSKKTQTAALFNRSHVPLFLCLLLVGLHVKCVAQTT